jgi:16S rRNA (guanine966-N2)-methyltransferase
MSDKMRGALFNILGDMQGLDALDAFGGSGALSFEAASRGVARVLVLDNDRAAQNTIHDNIRELGLDRIVTLVRASTDAWLGTNPSRDFDVVLCDPPYDDLQPRLLVRLAARTRPGGLLVLSYPAQQEAPLLDPLERIKQQMYGDAQLIFYRAPQR